MVITSRIDEEAGTRGGELKRVDVERGRKR